MGRTVGENERDGRREKPLSPGPLSPILLPVLPFPLLVLLGAHCYRGIYPRARRAGIHDARQATPNSSSGTAAKVTGSTAGTPKSRLAT